MIWTLTGALLVLIGAWLIVQGVQKRRRDQRYRDIRAELNADHYRRERLDRLARMQRQEKL